MTLYGLTGNFIILNALSSSTTLSGLGNIAVSDTLTVGNAGSGTISGIISGAGQFIKGSGGAGTLTLSNVNTYTGSTSINGGTLSITNANALFTPSSAGVSVNSGATLDINGVAGSFKNLTLNGGTLSGTGTASVGTSSGE